MSINIPKSFAPLRGAGGEGQAFVEEENGVLGHIFSDLALTGRNLTQIPVSAKNMTPKPSLTSQRQKNFFRLAFLLGF
jgi:hypothetical protein